jgi:hypothetical protein
MVVLILCLKNANLHKTFNSEKFLKITASDATYRKDSLFNSLILFGFFIASSYNQTAEFSEVIIFSAVLEVGRLLMIELLLD